MRAIISYVILQRSVGVGLLYYLACTLLQELDVPTLHGQPIQLSCCARPQMTRIDATKAPALLWRLVSLLATGLL